MAIRGDAGWSQVLIEMCWTKQAFGISPHGLRGLRCGTDGFATHIRCLVCGSQWWGLDGRGVSLRRSRAEGVLLFSESSPGSSSMHEARVPQARRRRCRQALNSPATSPGRVLTGFHTASEVLTQISLLFLIPSSEFSLKGKSLDGCSNPRNRLIMPSLRRTRMISDPPQGFSC
jgi:hypothetical protein